MLKGLPGEIIEYDPAVGRPEYIRVMLNDLNLFHKIRREARGAYNAPKPAAQCAGCGARERLWDGRCGYCGGR